ncbi:Sodium- and chloride-dependent taurine transporter [Paragonimus heterotremus]|uniref:Transporter n=1 Tax=Paragonimus heterotremus TaxID=100268 RepID=A0A8J4WME8_9TREM|nr:Sodium- and chloride-dependent taurine transporter [Paragonimus heterotremus]
MVNTQSICDGSVNVNANGLDDVTTCAWESDLVTDNVDKPLLREQWKRKIDFLIACMGFSIGLGNVWRFPYLCYKNGGGAFLIPYFLSVFFAGIPLFLLEVALGQLMSKGPIAAWNICPLFRGIGCASTLINFMVNSYYTVILSWGVHYLFASFNSVLPWTRCDQWWNSPHCGQTTNSSIAENRTQVTNSSLLTSDPVTEYWENRVLGLSSGIDQVGNIQWELALCLLLAWTVIFLCICKGIKTSGRVMYFTATSPYVFMIILLIRTSLLDGAKEGLRYYLQPDWSKLVDMMVWSDAGTQIFFSYALSLGALTALGSYNTFHHNSLRDCALFALINTLTSLLAGCVIFATLGNMALTSNVSIDLVAESGPGLAFVIYPKALGTMPGSPFWSVCFFLMLLLLGVDSMFGGVEGFVAAFADYLPRIHSSSLVRCLFVGSVCIVSYFVGLTMVTNVSGRRFTQHMECMYGFSIGWLPQLFWCVITPVFTLILFVFSVIVYEELSYRRAGQLVPYQFPDWSVKLGWMMAGSSVLLVPITMFIQILTTPGSLVQRFRYLLQPRMSDNLKQKLALYKAEDNSSKMVQNSFTESSTFNDRRSSVRSQLTSKQTEDTQLFVMANRTRL